MVAILPARRASCSGRFRWAGLLSLPLVLAACQQGAGRCRLDEVAALPITPAGGYLLATIAIEGQPATLIVDTGAFRTILSADGANRLGLKFSSEIVGGSEGIGGRREYQARTVGAIDVGTLHFPNASLIETDFTFASGGVPIDGLLGMDLLGRYDLDIDVIGGRLTMFRGQGDCTRPTSPLDPPLYQVDMLPGQRFRSARFTVAINGQQVRAELDSGAARTMLFKHAADRLQLAAGPGPTSMVSGIGAAKVAVTRQVVKSIGIGGLEIDNLPILLAEQDRLGDTDMLLGRDLLGRIHFWISQSSQTVLMQAPPQASHARVAAAPR